MEAIDALNQAEGANKSSISKYMETKYGEMGAGHADLLTTQLNQMKDNGDIVLMKNNYLRPGPEAPLKRGRGRPPKAKEAVPEGTATVSAAPRPRGRPKKDPKSAPAPKKAKVASGPPSVSKTGRPRGRPRKAKPQQPLQNGVEA